MLTSLYCLLPYSFLSSCFSFIRSGSEGVVMTSSMLDNQFSTVLIFSGYDRYISNGLMLVA